MALIYRLSNLSRTVIPTDPWINLDGRLNAPAGVSAQYPNLFTDPAGGPPQGNLTNAPYPLRPPWKVSGVDYGVGVPAAIAANYGNPNNLLLSPNNGFTTNAPTVSGNILHTASTAGLLVGMGLTDSSGSGTQIPPGTTVVSFTPTTVTMSNNVTSTVNSGDGINTTGGDIDTVNKVIDFTGDNIVLDGYSFNGWQIFWKQSNNPIVQNNNFFECSLKFFGVGNIAGYGSGLTFQYNIVDAGINVIPELLVVERSGTALVQYNWLKNAKNNTISNGMQSLIFKYNLIENHCTTTTAADHGDIMQTFPNGVATPTFTANNANIGYTDGAGNAATVFLQIGDITRFYGAGLPAQFNDSTFGGAGPVTDYFVVNVTSTTFQVSATSGGPAITPTTAGTGTMQMAIPQRIGVTDITLAFNCWALTTKMDKDASTIGLTSQGNSHQNLDTAGAGYALVMRNMQYTNNVFLAFFTITPGGAGSLPDSWARFSLVQTQGPCNIRDNYVDLTGLQTTAGFPQTFIQSTTPNAPSPGFTGPITETNNLLLANTTSATFTGNSTGTTTLTVSTPFSGYIQQHDVLSGAGVPGGTTIISQLTGTPHGTGTYQTSVATTLTNVACTTTILATAVGTLIPTTFS